MENLFGYISFTGVGLPSVGLFGGKQTAFGRLSALLVFCQVDGAYTRRVLAGYMRCNRLGCMLWEDAYGF